MHARHSIQALAQALALFAVLFGGLAYGAGNMPGRGRNLYAHPHYRLD